MPNSPNLNDDLPRRKHPAHGMLFVDGQPTVIFDTICTKDRVPWLANHEVHELLRKVWTEATAWCVGRYMIMPNHIHLFAAGTESSIAYKNWVQYWKSQFSKGHKVAEHRWQTDDWDTRMRSPEQFEDKWAYVVENPVRKGLVARSEGWPYQGVIFDWRWE
jgi:REP-associated tyrosine transposase